PFLREHYPHSSEKMYGKERTRPATRGSDSTLFLFFPSRSECSSEGTLLSRLKKEKVKPKGY
ncbi:MAG: hypothetical protein Q7J22_00890, partial [Candidatus Wolfebacteria bacterium]|nr:hypothetical protein [Candidatus Wolfebacteria bacterium]